MAFRPMAAGMKTAADFYKDAKFKICIQHISLYEGAGYSNRYLDKNGILCRYPFGLGKPALEDDDLDQLQTKTTQQHRKVMPIVLNEYYIRYYKWNYIHLIKNNIIARCAFDIVINIGNLEAFRDGVNDIIPGCIRLNPKLSESERTADIEKLNTYCQNNNIQDLIENIAFRRIQRHSELFWNWAKYIKEAKAAGETKLAESIAAYTKDHTQSIGNSLLKRSLSMTDGDYRIFHPQKEIDRCWTSWCLI